METKMIKTVKKVPQLEERPDKKRKQFKFAFFHLLLDCFFFFCRRVFIRIYITFWLAFWQNNLIFFKMLLSFLMHICFNTSAYNTFYGLLVQMFCHIHIHKFYFHSNNYYAKKIDVWSWQWHCVPEPTAFNLFMDLYDEQFVLFPSLFCQRKMQIRVCCSVGIL